MFHNYVKLPEGTFQFSRIMLWSYHRPSHLSRQKWAFDAHTLGIDRIDQFTLGIATETTTLDSHLRDWNSVFNRKNKWPTEAPTIATEWQELIGEVLSVICNPLFRREGSPGTLVLGIHPANTFKSIDLATWLSTGSITTRGKLPHFF